MEIVSGKIGKELVDQNWNSGGDKNPTVQRPVGYVWYFVFFGMDWDFSVEVDVVYVDTLEDFVW